MRQTVKRHARNTASKRSLRGEMKVLSGAIEAKDAKKAIASLSKVQSELDKAVKKNILKKNTVARRLQNLSAKVKAIGAKPTPAATKAKKAPIKKVAAKKPVAKAKPVKKAPAKKPVAKKSVKKTVAKK